MIPLGDDIRPARRPVMTWLLLAVDVGRVAARAAGRVRPAGAGGDAYATSGWFRGSSRTGRRSASPCRSGRGWRAWSTTTAINRLTPLLSIFLHGGWGHIIGNSIYLWVFGNNVEGAMGPMRFLGVLSACAGSSRRRTHVAVESCVRGADGRRVRRDLRDSGRIPACSSRARESACTSRRSFSSGSRRCSCCSSGSASSSWRDCRNSRAVDRNVIGRRGGVGARRRISRGSGSGAAVREAGGAGDAVCECVPRSGLALVHECTNKNESNRCAIIDCNAPSSIRLAVVSSC